MVWFYERRKSLEKKKAAKGMLTAYRKYKEQSLSVKKPRVQKSERRTWQDKFDSKYDALATFIAAVEIGTLDSPARDVLISRLAELKKTAAQFLAKIKSIPVKDTVPPESPVRKRGNMKEKKPAVALPVQKEEENNSANDKPETMMLDFD